MDASADSRSERRRPEVWEPWEAHRTRLPRRPDSDVREAREDARLLLMVVRARFAEGRVPFEHAEALARAAVDERLTSRLRLRAGEALARLRMAGMKAEAARTQGDRWTR